MQQANNGAVIPPAALVAHARRYVETHGVNHTARELGISRQALAALLAGLPVRRGSVAVVAQALNWRESDTAGGGK